MSTHHHDASFDELMAEQIRHAPWVALSVIVHVAVGFIFWLMPATEIIADQVQIQIAQTEPPEVIEEDEPDPLIEPKVEETTEEPTLEELFEAVDENEVSDNDSEFVDMSKNPSAFDFTGDNTAIGLAGGAAGKYGGRPGGGNGPGAPRPEKDAIVEALKWLYRHQDEDGKWDADEFMKHDVSGTPCDGMGNPVHDVGLTGLALLAFLGDGHTLQSGKYKRTVKKAVRWLRSQQDVSTGLIGTNNTHDFVYDHAIAAYALIEAYGLSNYRTLRPYAQRAINYLETHRNPYGVWRYQPREQTDDSSITGWCVMAYKSAQDFKLDVNSIALKNADVWFDSMTDPTNGRTGYVDRGGLSSRRPGEHEQTYPRERGECMTAVSLLCQIFMGHNPKEKKLMKKQANLISKRMPTTDPAAIDHYYWYYGTYALYQMGGTQWKNWSKALNKAVVKTQRKDDNSLGSWNPDGVWGEDGGRVYATAINCLSLQAYYRYTPLVR